MYIVNAVLRLVHKNFICLLFFCTFSFTHCCDRHIMLFEGVFWHFFEWKSIVYWLSVSILALSMGQVIADNIWTDILPCSLNEIDSLFQVKIWFRASIHHLHDVLQLVLQLAIM